MKFLKKLGFRDADEMDMHIAIRAAHTSWVVVIIALLIWSFYDFFTKAKLTEPFIILSIGLVIYFVTILHMRKRLSSGDNQEQSA